MSERPFRPDCMPGLMPYLLVSDVKRSIGFYVEAFGFKLADTIEKEGRIEHAEMCFLDNRIMLGPEDAPCATAKTPKHAGVNPALSLYVYCKDVDGLFKKAVAAGAQQLMAPETMFWGDRMCRIADIDGHEWAFAQNVADFDPNKIP